MRIGRIFPPAAKREGLLGTDRRAWGFLAAGLAAGGLVAGLGGERTYLYVLAAALAAALVAAVLRRQRNREGGVRAPANVAERGMPEGARDIFEHLPDPVMLLDPSGRIVFANRAMRGVVGTDAQRKHVSSVWRTPVVLAAIERTTQTGAPTSVEFTIHVPVERNYEAHLSRTGQSPRLTALLLHDLTAMKRAEEARADFVANASHELRTPLAAVSGFIDTLKGHAKDDPAARDRFLDIMSVEAGRMRRLIDDLLSLTRIEQNEHVPPSDLVDLVGVVRDAAAALAPLAQADDVTVTVVDPGPIPPVLGQRDELIQLFQNLIHNAIKYGRRGGHVWLSLEQSPAGRGRASGALISVSVRDDGEGIPREAIPRLTERFYRVDVKRSRERGGTGLGLAIVKHILNRHQGRMQIESQAGEGSRFIVSLPAAAAGQAGRAGDTGRNTGPDSDSGVTEVL